MLKIYGSRDAEAELIEILAEFPRLRVFLSYPMKGCTRKVRRSNLFKVTSFPLTSRAI
jgi:hypothetical protein